MNQEQKHFNSVRIYTVNFGVDQLVLNDNSFWDITFDEFVGDNIDLIHQNAFGKAAKTIKWMYNYECCINHQPPQYHIWKVFNELVNVENISVNLNITEIPSQAFNGTHLKSIEISTPNRITIKQKAFNNLDNLTDILLASEINKIEKDAFHLNASNQTIKVGFFLGKFDKTQFDVESFYVKRPVDIELYDADNIFVGQKLFRTISNDNNFRFGQSLINCFDCKNYWLMRNIKDKQVSGAKCMHNNSLTLFSPSIRSHLEFRCNLSKSINFDPCQYCSKHVS